MSEGEGRPRGTRYCRARYYHTGLQRFVSGDPIGFAAGDINLYGYVANNPLTHVDPLGLEAFVTIYDSTNQPFGHSGIGVNTRATVGFHPIEGTTNSDLVRRRPVPGRVVSDRMSHLTPSETFRTPTSPAQNVCLTNFIGQRAADPGVYILGGRSCGEFVRDALQACGSRASDQVVSWLRTDWRIAYAFTTSACRDSPRRSVRLSWHRCLPHPIIIAAWKASAAAQLWTISRAVARLMTILWPASFGLMAIHAGSTTSDVIVVYTILVLVNAILYGAIGAAVAALIRLGRRWRGGRGGNRFSNKNS